MTIAICDDETPMRMMLFNHLEHYSAKRGLCFTYDEFADGAELISSGQSYDLIFLDYKMKNTDGLETARELRRTNNNTPIIFLSSYPNIVFDTFEVNAYRFLVKPIDETKLSQAMDSLLASIGNNNCVIIKNNDITQRINTNDIIYAEAENTHCCIRLLNESIIYKKTLSDFEKLLHDDCFFRCHRSYLINMQHIVSFTDQFILLDNQEKALISKLRRTSFKQAYLSYIKCHHFTGR